MTTAEDQWAPLEIGSDETDTYTALRDDVPPWLAATVWTWVNKQFTGRSDVTFDEIFRVDLARKCERVLRVSIRDQGQWSVQEGFNALRLAFDNPRLVWRLVDFLLASAGRSSLSTALGDALVEAGSAWQVGERHGKLGLVRRVPQGVVTAAEAAFQKPNAGNRLAAAWEEAFGVNPDPSNAYSLAVKAVEDASIPVVATGRPEPTLGDVIRTIDNGTWRLPHLREHNSAPTHDVLVGMLRTLWRGHHDRHGGPSSVGVPTVTQEEAESAVILAVTLVGWFESGHIQQ